MVQHYETVDSYVAEVRPSAPAFVIRPAVLKQTAEIMRVAFPGDMLYAVKVNEHPQVLQALYDGGIRHFDTASIEEIRTISRMFPDAVSHYMHPVKPRESIAEAYFEHGVRAFVFDHVSELDKILDATGHATDLILHVRLAMPKGQAKLCLSGKFGAPVDEAAELLRLARHYGREVGATFHVGSQCENPDAFVTAVELTAQALDKAGIDLDVLDVGGGFPGYYSGTEPVFPAFVKAILDACDRFRIAPSTRLQCEPGRALVAEGQSVLTRIDLRRRNALFVNDGTYGGLAEVKYLGNCFPMRLIRPDGYVSNEVMAFDLFGPTCDSIDSMPGPHWLPVDADEGDWVEVGLMGAYSNSLRTRFNGLGNETFVVVDDNPFAVSLPEEHRKAA